MDHSKFSVSTDKSKLDLEYIHQYLSVQSYWAFGIPKDTVRRSIENSLCFGLYEEERQIGFGRVVSDMATFAYLCDIFVDEKCRGLGLGNWLMQHIMAEPRLQGLRRWMLGTRDAHRLYEKSGFTPLDHPERIMQKHDPQVYTRSLATNPFP